MNKSFGIVGSVSVLVGLPALLALSSTAREPKDPTPGALTVSVSDSSTYIMVNAPGSAPTPSATSILVSGDGKDKATVKAESVGGCTKVTTVYLASTSDSQTSSWCLHVSGLPGHGTVVGTVTGAETKLTLTVQRRAAFFTVFHTWPSWILAIGLLIALFSTYALSMLGTGIVDVRLRLLIALNARRPAAKRVDGITAWVQQRKAQSAKTDDLVTTLSAIVQTGPIKASAARAILAGRLRADAATLPDDDLVVSARREAARTDNLISDFVALDGTATHHPATVLSTAIDTLASYAAELASLDDEAKRLPDPSEMSGQLRAAHRTISRVKAPGDLPDVKTALDSARAALDHASPNPAVVAAGRQRLGDSDGGLPVAPTLAAVRWLGAALGLAIVTAAVIAVALGFAAVTVYVSGYDAKPTFGSWQDGFALFSSAVGSGVAATVLGLLAPWRSDPAPAKP